MAMLCTERGDPGTHVMHKSKYTCAQGWTGWENSLSREKMLALTYVQEQHQWSALPSSSFKEETFFPPNVLVQRTSILELAANCGFSWTWSGHGRSCVCPGPRAKGVRGRGGTASQGGGQHPAACPAVPRGPRWDTSRLSLLPLLKGWEEPWQWDFSSTATWTQVRPNTRRLQLSPWRHLQSKKTLCWLSAQDGLQPFRKEKLSVEVNPLLLVLSFQELDSQICLVFSGFFGPSPQSPTVTLEEGEPCIALSPPAPALTMPCCP